MSDTMKAALLYGPRDVRVIDVPKPSVGPLEALVKVKICMTSGTTVKQYARGYPGRGYPHGFGYEWAGEIVEVGEGVDKSLIGKKCISFAPEYACNSCFFCIRGQSNLCAQTGHALDKVRCEVDEPEKGKVSGYFKEYTKEKISELYILPEHMHIDDACQIPYVAYAIHGHKILRINPGDYVACVGAGAMGVIQMMLAHLKGAKTIAIDVNEDRLDFAKKVGAADFVIKAKNAHEAKMALKDLNINNGWGPDIVIEAVGLPQTYEEAVELVRRGGQVLLYGGIPEGAKVTFDTYRLHYDEIAVFGSSGVTMEDVIRARNLVEWGTVKPSIFITDRFPLIRIKEALELHLQGKGIKFAIIP